MGNLLYKVYKVVAFDQIHITTTINPPHIMKHYMHIKLVDGMWVSHYLTHASLMHYKYELIE